MAQSDSVQLNIGRALGDAAAALRQNWSAYLILTILFVALPAAASTWGVEQLVARHILSRGNFSGAFLIGFVRSFAVSLTSCVVLIAIIRGAMDFFQGRRLSLSEGFASGLGGWIPLFLLELMRAAAIDIGYLFLFVPGLMLSVAWWIAAPALVIERLSPMAALLRSAELTRGRRWPLFRLSMIVGIFGLLVGFVGGLIGGFVFGFLNSFGIRGFSAQLLSYPLSVTISMPVVGAIVAAVYNQLSHGRDPESVSQVFA